AWQTKVRAQRIYVGLELRGVDQFFMAAVKEVAQIVKKLSEVGSLDETFQPELLDPLPQKNVHVLGQEHEEILLAALQDAKAICVKGSRPDGSTPSQPAIHAGFQFGGGVLSEGDGQDFVRPGVALLDQPGDAFHQHRSFSGAGAGQHQHRPMRMLDSLALLRVGDDLGGHRRSLHYAKIRRKWQWGNAADPGKSEEKERRRAAPLFSRVGDAS